MRPSASVSNPAIQANPLIRCSPKPIRRPAIMVTVHTFADSNATSGGSPVAAGRSISFASLSSGAIARMFNPIPLEPGKRIGVFFDLAKAHLFATDGGRSIAAKGG